MHYVLIILILLTILVGPNFWVRYVVRRHSYQREDIPGSGGELARHLLDRYKLSDVGVEETDKGDHYDPISRTVRLSKDNFSGRSLTAVAIAAHEVGHAIQHGSGYRLLMLRNRLVTIAAGAEQVGAAAIFIAPIIAAVTRTPASGGVILIFAISGLAIGTLVHLITLPVELDASFKKALPILQAGEYLNPEDLPAARQILRAAAFTYVAGSLMGLINFWRWLAILRRRI